MTRRAFTPALLPEPTPTTTPAAELAPIIAWWLSRPSDPWAATFYWLVDR